MTALSRNASNTEPDRIVVLDSGYDSYEVEKSLFTGAGYRFDIYRGHGDRSARLRFARDAAGILVRQSSVDRELFKALTHLRAVVCYGAGHERIDLDAATSFGVRVANVGGYASHSVSDHALALMFACSRALFPGRDSLEGGFSAPPHPGLFELHDKTLGIIGLGRIGGALCRKAQCLFERILASDPYIPKARFDLLGATEATLDQVLEQSHVISLHCPLTPETRGLIGSAAFERMARHPILINTARGGVVDETALLNALERDLIHGAGLDVYEQEPVTAQQQPILAHPRTVCTGHYAWYSDRALAELQRRAALNMLALLGGEIPADCLNP